MRVIGWLSLHRLVVFSGILICSVIWAFFFFSLSQGTCYIVRGGALGIRQGKATRHCAVALPVEEGSEKEQCCLFSSLPAFSHFHHYPEANWALLVLIPR